MAKNHGLLNLSGTIGSTTFSKKQSGTSVGAKPGPTREQVLYDERFDRTRRNAGEFRMAVRDSSLLHYALGKAMNGVRSQFLNGRMKGLLYRVAIQDCYNGLGSRQAAYGDCSLLTGFEFNEFLPLDQVVSAPFEHSLDATTGSATLQIPPLTVSRKKAFPTGTTHFRIVSCAVVLNFLANDYDRSIKTSGLLALSKKTPQTICFEHTLKVSPGEVLLQVMGIEFYKVENGKEKLLKGGVMRILEAQRMEYEVIAIKEKEESKEYTAKELQSKGGLFIRHLAHRKKALCHPTAYEPVATGNKDCDGPTCANSPCDNT